MGKIEHVDASRPNQALAGELHKKIIRKLLKGKVNFSFMDNIQLLILVDLQLISP